jgi:hypothetical protein
VTDCLPSWLSWFASRVLATGIILWREKRAGNASFALPDGSRLFSPRPAQIRPCHLLRESPLLARAGCPRRDGSRVVPGDGKPPRFCLECRCRAFANPRLVLLAAFSRPLSRCYPLSYCPPLLCLFCVDGTSSAQRTSSVISLHMQILHREDVREGGSTVRNSMHQGGTALIKRRASQRKWEL